VVLGRYFLHEALPPLHAARGSLHASAGRVTR
jgi:hypothetical protein